MCVDRCVCCLLLLWLWKAFLFLLCFFRCIPYCVCALEKSCFNFVKHKPVGTEMDYFRPLYLNYMIIWIDCMSQENWKDLYWVILITCESYISNWSHVNHKSNWSHVNHISNWSHVNHISNWSHVNHISNWSHVNHISNWSLKLIACESNRFDCIWINNQIHPMQNCESWKLITYYYRSQVDHEFNWS